MKHNWLTGPLLLALAPLWPAAALIDDPGAAPQAPDSVSTSEKRQLIASLRRVLGEVYVYPDRLSALEQRLEGFVHSEAYERVTDATEFAAELTEELFAASGDLHFRVSVDREWIAADEARRNPARMRELAAEEVERARDDNFGFRAIRQLEGNVGYFRFDYFHDPEPAGRAVAAVTELLAHTDALIIDLRENSGGYLEMAQVLLSHLFSADPPRQLVSYHDVQDGERTEREQWVLPSVVGTRMPDTPLYVLTSASTFSAGEWFAYVLQSQDRAVICGELTAGGAHPVGRRALDGRFVLDVPTGEVRDALRGDDFEGTGVAPDLAVRASLALHAAHRHALERLAKAHPDRIAEYAWHLTAVDARLDPPRVPRATLEALVGTYGTRRVWLEDGIAMYGWNERGQAELYPLGEALFALRGTDRFRFELVRDEGQVVGLRRVHADGTTRLHARTR